MTTEDLLRQAYAAFNHRDIDAALALMTDDVTWPKASEGGTVVGKDEIRAYWTRQWAEFDPRVDPQTVSALDQHRYSVRVHQVVKTLQGDVLADDQVVHLFFIRDNKIAGMSLAGDSNQTSAPSAAFAHQS